VAEGVEAGEREESARLVVSTAGADSSGEAVVRAGGGVVVHPGEHGTEVLLVHRPRYDDWSFPKGKRDGDETDEETAVREVLEETGLAVVLGHEVGEARYRDSKGRPKVVRYWLMAPDPNHPGPGFSPNHEVDELRWCSMDDAGKLLSYEHDRALLRHVAEGLRSTS
jgi:8-oxo-dGTP pyrophosphatase MutT (NUDIX family)